MKAQFLSGYVLSSVKDILSEFESSTDFDSLLEHLSAFDIEYNFKAKQSCDSILAVYQNIVSRGLPTLPSLWVEETISNAFSIAERKVDELGKIDFKSTGKLGLLIDRIYQSLFVVDPRITPSDFPNQVYDAFGDNPPNGNELKFITYTLPYFSSEAFCQLIEAQREISSVVKHNLSNNYLLGNPLGSVASDFFAQRLDLSFDLPYAKAYVSGLAIEIDGPQHREQAQDSLDILRDKVLLDSAWSRTLRVTTEELPFLSPEKEEILHNFFTHPYCSKLEENYRTPLWNLPYGLEALQIALTPFGVARIQKTVLFLIQNGVLDITAASWQIAVIERDVPCAFHAIADIQIAFEHLFKLEGKGRKLPKIILEIYRTKEFESCILNHGVDAYLVDDFDPSASYDAVLDISMLQRSGFSYPATFLASEREKTIKIRSVHSLVGQPKVMSSKPIEYKISTTEQTVSLTFFLKNIFRKNEFLEGQVDILRKTLALDSVIALLPTGAGKSLTYQLSTLLQPGISLIIDPIKSLMRDQDQNLREMGIDSTTFINSSVSAQERNIRSREMTEGKYQFIFVSPERLQIQEFRDYLSKMNDTYFSYCVVDEAHCVSEWGHDFRTAYLRLGENLRKYCHVFPKSKKSHSLGLQVPHHTMF